MKQYTVRDAFNAETVYSGDDLHVTREKNGYVAVVRGTETEVAAGHAELLGLYAWPVSVILGDTEHVTLNTVRDSTPRMKPKSMPKVAGGNRSASLRVRPHQRGE